MTVASGAAVGDHPVGVAAALAEGGPGAAVAEKAAPGRGRGREGRLERPEQRTAPEPVEGVVEREALQTRAE